MPGIPRPWRTKSAFSRDAIVSIASIVVLGLLLTLGGAAYMEWDQTEHIVEHVQLDAQERAARFERQLERNESVLTRLGQTRIGPNALDPIGAAELAAIYDFHVPWISHLAWIPNSQAHRQALPDTKWVLTQLARDARGAVYGSYLPALNDSGSPTAPDTASAGGSALMAFAVPVFSETGDGEDPAGFWLGSIEISRLLLSLLPPLATDGLHVQLHDDSAPADESLLFAWPSALQPTSELCNGKRAHMAFFNLGGKQWSLHTFYTPEYIALRRTDANKWWRVVGLLLTTVIATTVARRTVGTSLLQRDAAALQHDLAESRRRFESVVTCMPDWVWETDAEGRYTYCSPRVRDILGYRPDELVGHSPFETMPDEEAKRVSAIVERYKIARDPFQGLENWNLAADGHLICILSNGRPIIDQQGVLQGYRGVNTEITERVRAAADFAEALGQLKSILDAATQVGIVATDLTGEITAFNTGAERMLGYRAPEAIGKLNLTALHEPGEIRDRGEALSGELGYPVENFDAIVALVRHGGSDQTEWTLRRKDGSRLLASVSFTAMYDDAGNLSGFLAISHDITERKRGEEELRRLGRAVEQASDGIAITSLEGVIQFVNLGWAQMHGTSVESLLGKHISFFHTQQQYEGELAPLVDRTRRFGTRQGEVGHLLTDGSLFPAWTSCTTLEDEANHPIGFVHVASDITARKRSEEALRQAKEEAEIANRELERSVEHANRMALEAEIANQAKSEFLANMSHEIRTPMNGILGMGSLLLDTDLESEQADYVQTMRSCAGSLLTIINDILDFSKIEAGKMDLEILDFDLRTTCDDMNSMLALRAQEKGRAPT